MEFILRVNRMTLQVTKPIILQTIASTSVTRYLQNYHYLQY